MQHVKRHHVIFSAMRKWHIFLVIYCSNFHDRYEIVYIDDTYKKGNLKVRNMYKVQCRDVVYEILF